VFRVQIIKHITSYLSSQLVRSCSIQQPLTREQFNRLKGCADEI